MGKSKIAWTDRTWNPITGCTKISPGCDHCYAERMSKRLAGRSGYDRDEPFKVTYHPKRLSEPLRATKPHMYFVCSMGDLFHDDVEDKWFEQVFDVILECHRRNKGHVFQLLTKRPRRMVYSIARSYKRHGITDPLPGLWLGATVEDQKRADARIPWLLAAMALIRFISVEPMLGALKIPAWLELWPNFEGLNWVIVGGETGPGARPTHFNWVADLRDQCVDAEVPFFFKHWGEWQSSPDTPLMMTKTEDQKVAMFRDGYFHDWGDGWHALKVGKRAENSELLFNQQTQELQQWREFPQQPSEPLTVPLSAVRPS